MGRVKMGLLDRPGLLIAGGALAARHVQKKKQEKREQEYNATVSQQQEQINQQQAIIDQHQNYVPSQQEALDLQRAIDASRREVTMRSDLPSGWEEKYDPGSGKYYYIDHVNKKTQWEKPVVQAPVPPPPPAYQTVIPTQPTHPQYYNQNPNQPPALPPAGSYAQSPQQHYNPYPQHQNPFQSQ